MINQTENATNRRAKPNGDVNFCAERGTYKNCCIVPPHKKNATSHVRRQKCAIRISKGTWAG